MREFLFAGLVTLSVYCLYKFLTGKYRLAPLWLMLAAWSLALGVPQLHLSKLELSWPLSFWLLVFASLASFVLGFFIFNRIWQKYPFWEKFRSVNSQSLIVNRLRATIYFLFLVSLVALYLFYSRAGNLPLLSPDPDQFRFVADKQVPGLINYSAQLARIFIPLAFFLMFYQSFNLKKHWDLVLMIAIGTFSLILFASRTQVFFIDLWVMALYLFMPARHASQGDAGGKKPNVKQALKFYPAFLLVSILVLSAVPLYRQYKSYGAGYLAGVTQIDTSNYNAGQKFLLPIYVGISFNMQALLHAQSYYQTHPLQHGKVSLDPFTNLFGKVAPALNEYKSHFNLGDIFYSWWNTGTYLFPFVQDFGTVAFFFVPFLIAGILTLVWHYWKTSPNYLSINLYAYACFFIVMTIYLSFTVRAEMYIDLFLILVSYLFVSKRWSNSRE